MTDLLCEKCGYVLNGLPDTSRCPECGTPIAESIGNHRHPPLWETPGVKSAGFLRTSAAVLFHPTNFYRTLAVHGSVPAAHRFARWHWWISATLFAIAALVHSVLFWLDIIPRFSRPSEKWTYIATAAAGLAILVVATYLTYLMLDGITKLAARLTDWEARYRGLRLPYDVVLRGMYYHAAHYVPVALLAAITVVGGQLLIAFSGLSINSTMYAYVYGLSAEVVVSAAYLFYTYWIGMRNMMFANR
jgi:hypothetical protein